MLGRASRPLVRKPVGSRPGPNRWKLGPLQFLRVASQDLLEHLPLYLGPGRRVEVLHLTLSRTRAHSLGRGFPPPGIAKRVGRGKGRGGTRADVREENRLPTRLIINRGSVVTIVLGPANRKGSGAILNRSEASCRAPGTVGNADKSNEPGVHSGAILRATSGQCSASTLGTQNCLTAELIPFGTLRLLLTPATLAQSLPLASL